MFYELIDMEKIRRAGLYAILLVAILSVQEIFLSRVSIFGVHAAIFPIFPIVIGMLHGGTFCLVSGLICGVLCDCMFSETLVFYSVLMPTLAFLAMMGERFLFSRTAGAVFLCCTLGLIITALAQMLRVFVIYDASLLTGLEVASIQTLFSMVFIPILYLPSRWIAQKNFRQ